MERLKSFISKFFRKSTVSDSNKSFQEIWDDLGVFEYENDGFKIVDSNFSATIKWNSINKIVAFKKDLWAIDCIVMEIFYDEKGLTINEELAGWFQFVLKTKEIFPEIPKDWDLQITQPAFAQNYIVLFEKKIITERLFV